MARPETERSGRRSAIIAAVVLAVVGAALLVVGGSLDREQFFRSYLLAYVFWSGLALGSLLFAMMHPLVGGAWGVVARPALLGAARTLPLVALLFIPLCFGLSDLYPWARPDAASDPKLVHRLVYYNSGFFIARAAFFLVSWSVLAHFVASWSARSDPNEVAPLRLKALCAFGLVYYFLSGSFAVFDWILTLERDYDSTVFGFAFLATQAIGGLSFTLAFIPLMRRWLPATRRETQKPEPKAFRDLGSMLAASVLVWAYLQYGQWIINWTGDTKRDIQWYLHRSRHGWQAIALLVVIVHFAAPFFALLFHKLKQAPHRLARLCSALLVANVLAVWWLIAPSFGEASTPTPHWLDFAALLAVGAAWLAAAWWRVAPPAEETA